MNSAAKLRKRSVATLAASALLIGGVAPAAFAWDPTGVSSGDANNLNGVASLGLVDKDDNAPGTQGATVVAAGQTGQDLGEVRFVLPATFKKGDTVDFTIAATGGSGLVSYSGTPSITIDKTPYSVDTHIADRSGDGSAATGDVEAGKEAPYTGTGTPIAPTFTTEVISSSNTALNNVVRVTFTNDSNPATTDAKFIGSLSAKADIASTLSGDVTITASAADTSGTGTAPGFNDEATTGANDGQVTYPATIALAQMTVENGSVTADSTYQFVGPITVTPATGAFNGTDDVEITLAGGAEFDQNNVAEAHYYDQNGKEITGSPAKVKANSATTLSVTPTASVYKVVFTNVAIKAPTGTETFRYELTGNGLTAATPSRYLGGTGTSVATAPAHQIDIERPNSLTSTATTALQVPTRLGGQDRYQTAVKIAQNELHNGSNEVRGESDNVVIASGEGFADALSAGYLAATKDASLILTRRGELPQTDVEFLKTYGAKNIFIVGGYGSVSKAVEDRLKSLQSFDVQAADGATMPGDTVTTYTTTFSGLPAGVTMEGNPISGQAKDPKTATSQALVITRAPSGANNTTTSDNDVTGVTLNSAQPTSLVANNDDTATATFLVNGKTVTVKIAATAAAGSTTLTATDTTSQSPTVVPLPAELATGDNRKLVPLQSTLTVTRLAGNDRFETNKKVNMYAAESSVNPIGKTTPSYGQPGKKTGILANGWAPWDALAAGPLVGNSAGENPLPVILTRGGDSMDQYAADQIGGMDIKHLLFIGGSGVLSDALAKESNGRGVSTTRLGGDSRWATARAISEFAMKPVGVSSSTTTGGFGYGTVMAVNPYLANGGSMDGVTNSAVAKGAWADALAVGPVAARQRTIVALTDSEALPQETKDMLTAAKAQLDPVIALGLGSVTSTTVVNQANAAVAGK